MDGRLLFSARFHGDPPTSALCNSGSVSRFSTDSTGDVPGAEGGSIQRAGGSPHPRDAIEQAKSRPCANRHFVYY